MKKIFKYDLIRENGKWYAECPPGQVIRTDYVDDGYYKGYFVWVIVDPTDVENKSKRNVGWVHNENTHRDTDCIVQIGVLEAQYISLPVHSRITGVKDYDGRFWLYYNQEPPYGIGTERVKIRGYKTGQEIHVPEDRLDYLGFVRLWIKQELGIYLFRGY